MKSNYEKQNITDIEWGFENILFVIYFFNLMILYYK